MKPLPLKLSHRRSSAWLWLRSDGKGQKLRHCLGYLSMRCILPLC
jgi:hypothetical protein